MGTLTRAVERSLPTLASPGCEEERRQKKIGQVQVQTIVQYTYEGTQKMEI